MDRNFGILLPLSCLPSKEGIGTMGKSAYSFIDYLKKAKASVWQVLPLNPTSYGDSPYQSCSSNALNYYFIDLQTLIEEGLLKEEEAEFNNLFGGERHVNYGKQFDIKIAVLRKAFARFDGGAPFEDFVNSGEYADFAVFMALKSKFNHRPWTEWEEPYRTYDRDIAERFANENADEVRFWQFTQYIFLKQWNKLKSYANLSGISIMGDIPLYVAYDSVEVWKYGDRLFRMSEKRVPTGVAGCPPDGFTEEGQLWGNPVYDWKKMKEGGYRWWLARIDGCFKLYDILRIDHFRGFDRYWEVPYGEQTAKGGHWEDGPKEELFKDKLKSRIVAEDLGVIDDGVLRLMKNLGYPGMKVLEFAFDGRMDNEHKPSNHTENFVCYTGTHDNMPLKQYIEDLPEKERKIFEEDLIKECGLLSVGYDVKDASGICLSVIKLAFASKCATVIIPMWDLLCMGGEARINLPSTVSEKNWSWRFTEEDFSKDCLQFLKNTAENTHRAV